MLYEEFEVFNKNMDDSNTVPLITANDLKNTKNRTLLYGYTATRDTWHVYLMNNEIVTVVYGYGKKPILVEIKRNEDFVPNKRLYPERCDFEFCSLLQLKYGIMLPFTVYNQDFLIVDSLNPFFGKIW